jgi:[CysO sulfur-carrier protein]-S-L-cysteine hydrolase
VVLRILESTLEAIDRHAVESYPDECCGAVLADNRTELLRPITNIQDRLHAENPDQHPRDARTAYFMDPKELYAVLREAEEQKRSLRVLYHSHPDHDAYFSAEDKARAQAWDEPAYPETFYLVVSVIGGRVRDHLAVAWDAERGDFTPVGIVTG